MIPTPPGFENGVPEFERFKWLRRWFREWFEKHSPAMPAELRDKAERALHVLLWTNAEGMTSPAYAKGVRDDLQAFADELVKVNAAAGHG